MFVDSHCHLNDPKLSEHLPDVLKRAYDARVKTLLSIATDLTQMPELLALTAANPHIFCTVGVHPHEVDTQGPPSTQALEAYTLHPKVVGIGETGLDYYYEHSGRDAQNISFQNHLLAAERSDLPVVVHVRDAYDDTLTNLKTYKGRGVIHCFSGSLDFAEAVLGMGFYISISGIVTFPKAVSLQDIVKVLPLERLLIETDAPWLAPAPHRGKVNEPSYVVHTAQKIAELKQIPIEEVAQVTTQNFFDLFTRAT